MHKGKACNKDRNSLKESEKNTDACQTLQPFRAMPSLKYRSSGAQKGPEAFVCSLKVDWAFDICTLRLRPCLVDLELALQPPSSSKIDGVNTYKYFMTRVFGSTSKAKNPMPIYGHVWNGGLWLVRLCLFSRLCQDSAWAASWKPAWTDQSELELLGKNGSNLQLSPFAGWGQHCHVSRLPLLTYKVKS